jgi:hypothetical protein
MFDGLEVGLQRIDQRRESLVVEEHPVFGMIGDVDQLLGEEARD